MGRDWQKRIAQVRRPDGRVDHFDLGEGTILQFPEEEREEDLRRVRELLEELLYGDDGER